MCGSPGFTLSRHRMSLLSAHSFLRRRLKKCAEEASEGQFLCDSAALRIPPFVHSPAVPATAHSRSRRKWRKQSRKPILRRITFQTACSTLERAITSSAQHSTRTTIYGTNPKFKVSILQQFTALHVLPIAVVSQ